MASCTKAMPVFYLPRLFMRILQSCDVNRQNTYHLGLVLPSGGWCCPIQLKYFNKFVYFGFQEMLTKSKARFSWPGCTFFGRKPFGRQTFGRWTFDWHHLADKHFADGHLANRHFADGHLANRYFTNIPLVDKHLEIGM